MTVHSIRRQEQGLVSIMVAIVLMSILSVVVISFAFLMRREQQQALDRQLSTQAFYAAESGVSEAVADINNGSLTGDVSDCDQRQVNPLPGSDQASVTCVLIDQSPDSLEYSEVATTKSQVVKLQTATGVGINRIEVSWQASDPNVLGTPAEFATNSVFRLPTAAFEAANDTFSENTGILRAEFIPIIGSISRNNISSRAQTLFMYPSGAAFTTDNRISLDPTLNNADGAFVGGDCATSQTPYHCKAIVSGLGGISITRPATVFLRLKAIYKPVAVSIRAYDTSGNQLELINEQVVVDATGEAGSVLRRIQVRVPARSGYDYPEFALESIEDICKKLAVFPGGGSDACTP